MTRLKILLCLSGVLFIVISLLNSCASKMPAQQQRNTTTPQAPIAVTAVDTNNNGIIEVEEMEQALPHMQPSQISTIGAFGAIAGAVLILCFGCVWLTRNIPDTNSNSTLLDIPEDPEDLAQDQLLEEDFEGVQPKVEEVKDGGDWLDSGQQFPTGKPR